MEEDNLLRASQLIPHVQSTLETFQSAISSHMSEGDSVEYVGSLEDMQQMLALTIQHSLDTGETSRLDEQLFLNDRISRLLEEARDPRVQENLQSLPATGDVREEARLGEENKREILDEDIPFLPVPVADALPQEDEVEDINLPKQSFTCTICYEEDVEPADGYVFADCDHQFCREVGNGDIVCHIQGTHLVHCFFTLCIVLGELLPKFFGNWKC